MSGSNLNTLGKSYEVRGNGADGSHWRDKPLYGWVTHLPVGWVFTPAPGRGTCLTAASTPISWALSRAGPEALPAHGRIELQLPRSPPKRIFVEDE